MNLNSKILLILDIDETLIHARTTPLDRNADFTVFKYHIYKRPYLDEFFEEVSKHFNIAFWSSASDDYVNSIINIIYSGPKEFVWGRTRCTPKLNINLDEDGRPTGDRYGHYNYIKRLQKVKQKGYILEKTLMIDDTPSKIINSYGNAIYIKEFNGELQDIELKKLAKYLISLKDFDNVRHIEKRGWAQNIELNP